ncbi:MAG: methionine biosynthesis protein MetW [Sinobacterium sp.]|nr:methionine biosynthesis protein MetW [Sinobacterium sp.]
MRVDHDIIQAFVPPKSRVLDLGCGDGSLLQALIKNKSASGVGVEIDWNKFAGCLAKGISVIDQNIDDGLGNFDDQSFDVVIMSQTLQALNRPDQVLDEMLRVGREGIVAFPNFGHWRPRLHLIKKGRMPVSELMPYEWYDTPNIHFCTVKDFEVLCKEKGIKILHKELTDGVNRLQGFSSRWPNLFASTAIYHLSK